jgi:hypothetical protein
MLPIDGLFGHIQRNSFMSLALFGAFIVLREVVQFTIYPYFAALGARAAQRLSGGRTLEAARHELSAIGKLLDSAVADALPIGLFDGGWIYPLVSVPQGSNRSAIRHYQPPVQFTRVQVVVLHSTTAVQPDRSMADLLLTVSVPA